jgi:lipopolysaccharide export system permease protein
VFWSILHRTIFWELFKIFLLALIGLTGLVLLAGIVAEASQRGLSPGQLLSAIPLIIPSTLPYTIPATTLFATCLVYGRLAHDNEILAIKAAGINILRVVWPGALLGIATSAVTLGLYLDFIPTTQYMLRAAFIKDMEEFLYTMLRTERSINHPHLGYAIWVRQVQGRRLLDTIFKRRDAKGAYDMIARAREAELRVDSRKPQVLVHMRHGEVYSVNNATRAYFEDRVFEVPMPSAYPFGQQQMKKSREMTWHELLDRHREQLEQIDGFNAAIEENSALLAAAPASAGTAPNLQDLKTKNFFLNRERLAFEVEMQMRPALAVGCLCFVLVGCPVGIWFSKSDYLSAFITCFLPIVFLYYPILLCGINVARNGRFSPTLCIWMSDAIMGLIAVVLLKRLLRN